MKAVVLRETGDPEQLRWEEFADPIPGAGEVLVRLRASALNRRDLWIRKGQYAGIKLPIILGSDGAGEVVEVGSEVDRSLIGKAVVINSCLDWGEDERVQASDFRILGLPDNGTYAELVKLPASNVFPKPEALSFEEAATLSLAGLTAYRATVVRANIQKGETVLVTGIGGGVSAFVFQIAHHLGARLFVTSGSDEKLERAKRMGAEAGFNYRAQDWVKELKAVTDGGPQVVIDSVGGETFEKAIDALRPGGRLVTYGSTTGAAKNLEVRRIFWKQLNVLGSTMGAPANFEAMLQLYGGGLKPVISQTLPLAEAAQAHRINENNEQFGKIVLTIA